MQQGGKTTAARARRLEERLRFQAQLLDAVGEAVIAADRDGTITSWNPAAERLYGWSAEEAIGQRLADLLVADGRRQDCQAAGLDLRAWRAVVRRAPDAPPQPRGPGAGDAGAAHGSGW